MHSSTIIFALSALVSAAVAQTQNNNFNYTVDLSKVDLTTRAEWCRGERSVCDSLCGAPNTPPTKNECLTNSLEYTCTCQNGTAPGLQYYVNSLPTFMCEEAFKQCNAANVGNAAGQTACRNDIKNKCGTLDASTVAGGSSTTSSSSSASTPAPTQGGSSTSTSKAMAVPTQVSHYVGVAAAALMLGAVAL